MRTYTVNGQQMSEEEFLKFQQESGFNFGNFGNFNRQRKRWDHKPHLYQCYKDTPQGLWNEISLKEFKNDINKEPKFLKQLSYVQKQNDTYIIKEQPVVAIFYNHASEEFLYMNETGIIAEHNCFETYDEAFNAVKKLESKKETMHTLYDSNGNILMQFKPEDLDNSNNA